MSGISLLIKVNHSLRALPTLIRHILNENSLIKMKVPGISSIFSAFKNVKQNFPTPPESMDNSWLCQNVFYNLKFTRKQPNNKTEVCLKPTFYGIPDHFHTIKLKDLYPGGSFISSQALNTLTNTIIIPMNYENLKAHVKSKVGHNKHYDVIPLFNRPQKKIPIRTSPH